MRRVAPRALVAAWGLVKAAAIDVFRPGALEKLPGLPGWAALGLPAAELDHQPVLSLLDALRAFALRELESLKQIDTTAELVATLPAPDRNVLATADVVRTMLEGARKSILVVGYDVSEPSLRRLLIRRGLDNVAVTIVADRGRGWARELLKDWPPKAAPLRALENVEPAGQIPAMLHAKVIVVDESTALLGSANFTAGGMRNNIELGVRLSGLPVNDIQSTIDRLTAQGWLVPPAA